MEDEQFIRGQHGKVKSVGDEDCIDDEGFDTEGGLV